MSEVNGAPETTTAPAAPAGAAPDPAKRLQAETVLGEILKRMEIAGRLELKDAADGGISAAVFLEGEVPGLVNGKRTHLVDALQFLANKIVNRPQGEKRWISVGIGAHPEPRPPRPEKQPGAQQVQGQPAQPQQQRPPKPPREPREPRPPGQQPPAPAQGGGPARGAAPQAAAAHKPHHGKSHDAEELKLEVAEDPAVAAAAKLLAEKSAKHGRFYAVTPMKQEDRARFLKAVASVAGVKANAEGEGRARRVVLTPEKPVPMPKKGVMPDYDEDDA